MKKEQNWTFPSIVAKRDIGARCGRERETWSLVADCQVSLRSASLSQDTHQEEHKKRHRCALNGQSPGLFIGRIHDLPSDKKFLTSTQFVFSTIYTIYIQFVVLMEVNNKGDRIYLIRPRCKVRFRSGTSTTKAYITGMTGSRKARKAAKSPTNPNSTAQIW